MSAITIGTFTIRQDAEGRYSLNDLYQASGGEKRNRPSYWLQNSQTKGLIEELILSRNSGSGVSGCQSTNSCSEIAPLVTQATGVPGTYVVKQLVYAYAMWISPAFHLKVIDAYDALVTGEYVKPLTQSEKYWFARRPHWPQIRALALAGKMYRDIAATVGRSAASIRNALRRMVDVGLIDPKRLMGAQRGLSRRAAEKLCGGWGVAAPVQLALDLF